MQIRHFESQDYPAVQAIYQEGIASGHATFQTTAKSWEEFDQDMHSHSRLVAVSQGVILGWAAISPISARAVYSGIAEVSIYVAIQAHGKGIGKKLMAELIRESEKHNIWTLQSSIFPENIGSLKLHESTGFRIIGKREKIGKMNGLWRDTILMERRSQLV